MLDYSFHPFLSLTSLHPPFLPSFFSSSLPLFFLSVCLCKCVMLQCPQYCGCIVPVGVAATVVVTVALWWGFLGGGGVMRWGAGGVWGGGGWECITVSIHWHCDKKDSSYSHISLHLCTPPPPPVPPLTPTPSPPKNQSPPPLCTIDFHHTSLNMYISIPFPTHTHPPPVIPPSFFSNRSLVLSDFTLILSSVPSFCPHSPPFSSFSFFFLVCCVSHSLSAY